MKKLYTLFFIATCTLSFGQVFTANYDFAGVTATSGLIDPTPVPTAAGMTFGSFTASNPSSTNSTASARFSFDNQPQGATNADNVYANLAGSLSTSTYYEVTINPVSGTVYSLNGLTFRMQRSGTGVRTFAVRSSVDAYATNLTASINPTNAALSVETGNIFFFVTDSSGGQNGSTITLGGAGFTGLTGPVTLRFYGWNSEGSGGTFSIDDVAISGEVTTLSTKSFNGIDGFSMYPNPLKGNTLNFSSTANGTKSVQIFDVVGKEVVKAYTTNNTVNVANLNAGVYIVKVTEEGKTATRKLVVQ